MPLTLSAKFKVLQNQNYYGYHITGGKLFCTSVLNSNFSLHGSLSEQSSWLTDISSAILCAVIMSCWIWKVICSITAFSAISIWNVPVWHGSAWKIALPLACHGKKIILPEQNLSGAISRTVSSKKQNFTSVYL